MEGALETMATRHTLKNGLTVLLNEDHSSPVAAVLTHVKTGYFHEEDRLAGMSHLLEHMFFKGTPRRPGPEDIARATKAVGGALNAFTYYEETGYYTVAPSEHLAEALDIQADALANTMIDEEQLRRETEVVLQEGEQKRDSAWAFATENLYALSFDRHRIRRWRIGEPEVLRSWTRDDVMAYYRGTYHPENMILAISGDIVPAAALDLVRRHYEGITGGPRYRSDGPSEAPQCGPRYRQMRGDIGQRLALFGFHTTPSFHTDSYALDMLSAALSDGRSSRLYQGVRERLGLATAINTFHQTFRDIGYFVLAAESLTDDIDAAERALIGEIRRIQDEPPSEDEMERLRTRIRARLVFGSEEPLGQARRLASYEAAIGFEHEAEDMERLLAVTPGEISDVARRYLRADNASLLEYVPTGSSIREGDAATVAASFAGPAADRVSGAEPYSSRSTSRVAAPVEAAGAQPAKLIPLPNGELAARHSGSQPVVAVEILFRGGRLNETRANAGVTNLMLRSTLKGNKRRSGESLARAFEGMGTSLEWLHGLDYWGFAVHALEDRIEDALTLAAEAIQTPGFAAGEVSRERETMLAEIRRSEDNSSERALDLLDAAAYGEHPYSFPERGNPESLLALTPDDLHAWHADRIRAPMLVGAGGMVSAARLAELLGNLFPARPAVGEGPRALPDWTGQVERIEERRRNQTAAAIGFRSVDAASEDRFALDVIGQILSGLGGRLFAEVRGRQGLAYTVSAWNATRGDAGMFVAYTATAPENEERARTAILHELERLREEPVAQEELERAVTYIAGAKTISLQTSRAQARDLSRALVYGREVEASALYVERIRTLTPEDLLAAAQRYFTPDSFALGALRGTSA